MPEPSVSSSENGGSGDKSLKEVLDDQDDELMKEIEKLSTAELKARTMLLDNEIKIMKLELKSLGYEMKSLKQGTKDNRDKIDRLVKLPLLIGEVTQICDDEIGEDDPLMPRKSGGPNKGIILKTSFKKTIFVPNPGLLADTNVKPGDTVCTDKDNYTLVCSLPKDIDPRVKIMEVIERPEETYDDIGGLDKQIQELSEAVTLPLTHCEMFKRVGIEPPKGVLLYGPPGTGKTLLAKACAHHTQSTFLRLAGSQLVQSYIGEGAKMVRDAFLLARMKAPTIVFIDELDAVGSKRGDSERSGDREVHRTLIELLNQMDGFQPTGNVKVIGATNRVDVLDPALLRSGRMDRKIEFPEPDDLARTRVLKIHTRKMNLAEDVDLEELGRAATGFSCAMCKALCSEAAMNALRRQSSVINSEDFVQGIFDVLARKKVNLTYYS